MTLRLGVLLNPVAGLGGPVALKGSDGVDIQAAARARGAVERAAARMRQTLEALVPCADRLVVVTWRGVMGSDSLEGLPFRVEAPGGSGPVTTALDTRAAVAGLLTAGIDLLLFAGGDGTARDIAEAAAGRVPVLGVPAGVKMYSAVFAVTPADAAAVILRLLQGELVAIEDAEVRDVDEAALRAGRVVSRHYGYVRVPRVGGFVQALKSGGREDEALVRLEIARYVAERARADVLARGGTVVLGPGSTVAAIKTELGLAPTLLGFDVVGGGTSGVGDATAADLERIVDASAVVVLSFGAGQGILLGRGNQQLTPAVLRRLSRDRLWIVASRGKVTSLAGRPLAVDTGDAALDQAFSGVVEIVAGYDDRLLYAIGGR
jgi:predicted polyphosphate/ATP-dependent NAD kinase